MSIDIDPEIMVIMLTISFEVDDTALKPIA
jgi:hypothetical protein